MRGIWITPLAKRLVVGRRGEVPRVCAGVEGDAGFHGPALAADRSTSLPVPTRRYLPIAPAERGAHCIPGAWVFIWAQGQWGTPAAGRSQLARQVPVAGALAHAADEAGRVVIAAGAGHSALLALVVFRQGAHGEVFPGADRESCDYSLP